MGRATALALAERGRPRRGGGAHGERAGRPRPRGPGGGRGRVGRQPKRAACESSRRPAAWGRSPFSSTTPGSAPTRSGPSGSRSRRSGGLRWTSTSTARSTSRVWPPRDMIEQRWGRIVMVSSTAGEIGAAGDLRLLRGQARADRSHAGRRAGRRSLQRHVQRRLPGLGADADGRGSRGARGERARHDRRGDLGRAGCGVSRRAASSTRRRSPTRSCSWRARRRAA